MNWTVHVGDTRAVLASLTAASVQCCITSPPYWGLRDYGHDGQLGLEPTPDAYVAAMVEVFAGVRRVLTDDGTLWLNLGDSYQNAKGQAGGIDPKQPARRHHGLRPQDVTIDGLKPKDLVGIPWRVAFALQADGWYLRQDIIWHKPNPMPESVTDRCTKAHEYVFLLAKSARYYYDAEAIAEASTGVTGGGFSQATHNARRGSMSGGAERGRPDDDGTRNRRSVWTVPTSPYPEAHFATYPTDLIRPMVLAGSRLGDTVLDPFTGSGTTGAVAIQEGRSFVGVELNPDYVRLARARIGGAAPLFAQEVPA